MTEHESTAPYKAFISNVSHEAVLNIIISQCCNPYIIYVSSTDLSFNYQYI